MRRIERSAAPASRVSLAAAISQRLETQEWLSIPNYRPYPSVTVRTRRAYFDCTFGQLHVRTAFPTTGGFDEQVTLFCLHPQRGFEPQLRSILARNRRPSARFMRPICPASASPMRRRVSAIRGSPRAPSRDLATDFRLRRDRSVGSAFRRCSRPGPRRRAARSGAPPGARGSSAHGSHPLDQAAEPDRLKIKLGSAQTSRSGAGARCRTPRFVELTDQAGDLFDTDPKTWRSKSAAFLDGRLNPSGAAE